MHGSDLAASGEIRRDGRSLRVLHLNTFDVADGAARGSLWLHDALLRSGVESHMVVGRKKSGDNRIEASPLAGIPSALRMRFDLLPLRSYRKTADSFWTVGWLPARFRGLVRRFAPDIVHLHWVGAGFLPIQALKQFGCPIVWTLRDMWSFTGGCHYTAGCERYRERCGACPQLRSMEDADLSRTIWERKRRHWSGLELWLVPISDWLRKCTQESALLNGFPAEVIPNGLDLERFRPIDKRRARTAWNLPHDRPILLYGALRATRDPRKGFRELLAALDTLGSEPRTRGALLVVFGDLKPGELPDLGIETRYLGYIADDARLSMLYSSADLAVMPSLQEAFGKTLIEAMACRTPVVAFDSGGPRDIVSHRSDGYLAAPFDPADLAHGIAWCLDEIKNGRDLGTRARRKVETTFDINVVAARYHALYRRILAVPRTNTAAVAVEASPATCA